MPTIAVDHRGDRRAAVAADRVLDDEPERASTTESTAAIPEAGHDRPRFAGSTPRSSRKIA